MLQLQLQIYYSNGKKKKYDKNLSKKNLEAKKVVKISCLFEHQQTYTHTQNASHND